MHSFIQKDVARPIVHRNLTPGNIHFTSDDHSNNEVKISDFGFANIFDPENGLEYHRRSIYYKAPELLTIPEVHNSKVDIWSIGVIAYLLVSGELPFDEQTYLKTRELILDYNPI